MRLPNIACSIVMVLTQLCVVIPCMHYTCSLDWKPKDNRPFMVLLPGEAMDMPDFSRILVWYRQKIVRLSWIEAFISPLFLFLDVGWQLALMTIAIFAYLLVPPVFGRRAREELLALKKEKGWITQYTAIHRADLRLGKKDIKRRTHVVLFLLAMILPVVYAAVAFYTVVYREGVPSFSSLSGMGILEIVILTAAFWNLRKYRVWSKEVQNPDGFYSGDEDDYWHMGRFGIYYDNPYDPAVLKTNNSGGLNMNLNRGRPGSWIFFLVVWLVVAVPFVYFLGYPYYVDFSGELVDIRLSEDSGSLEIEGAFYHADISLEGMSSVELITSPEELGSGEKINGTGTSVYGKGRYRYEKCGPVISYTAYRHPPYILMTVEEDSEITKYLFNDDEAEVTRQVYETLQSMADSGL
ncbi:hypothetical protein NXH76_16130 [Blautia schinkii]|nr:hypothetical protein [Blautia schinkii]